MGLALAAVLGTAGMATAGHTTRGPDPRRVLVLDHGRVTTQIDPYLPPGSDRLLPAAPGSAATRATEPASASPVAPMGPRARGSKARPKPARTVHSELARMLRAGAISNADYQAHVQEYNAARRSSSLLSGTRRAELAAVIANLEQIAARGVLTVSRVPAMFETLTRNRQWWTTASLPSSGQRIEFADSRLVWEYYPGQGIEIQWLGTFGKANGYFFAHHDTELGELLDEAVSLAADRAGGVAWEYLFHFDGGVPPWTSALSQGTALQALARGAQRLSEPTYIDVGRQALAVFGAPPPGGVAVPTGLGTRYLIYSFAPAEHVLNGFIQSLVGLHDFAAASGDATARSLLAAGDAQARGETPRFDTGAWSLYDQAGESDLSYHVLLRDFLNNLCTRLRADARAAGATGASPAGANEIFCTTAQHFTADLHTPPDLLLADRRSVHAGRTASLDLTLSKISRVALSVRRAGTAVFSTGWLSLSHGHHSFSWRVPRGQAPGSYDIRATATDLAGNRTTAAATLRVLPRRP